MRRAAALLAATLAAVLVSACGPKDHETHVVAPTTDATTLQRGDHYVAMGDSYTAAPGIGPADAQNGCFRSTNNYPHLVAHALGLELEDVSCSGATTVSITGPQVTLTRRQVVPQVQALGADTALVTVSIGGNDFQLFSMISRFCPALAEKDPNGHPCITEGRKNHLNLDRTFKTLRERETRLLETIGRRAPKAKIVVVGYPAIVPEHGTCTALPLATGDYAFARRINRSYNTALKAAADDTGAEYVDTYTPTRGHDICSPDPWIAGSVAQQDGAPYHPYAAEQRAVAKAVEKALGH